MAKFCKDCKFCKRGLTDYLFLFGTYRFARCDHPRLTRGGEYYVDGSLRGEKYCSNEREYYQTLDVCGPDAKYFEAKK